MGKEVESREYIYQVKAIKKTATAQLKCIGYTDQGTQFKDEQIDSGKDLKDDGKKAIKLQDHIFISMFKANINHGYMLNNKKLPVMYASVIYQKPLVTGHLFNMFVMFTINSDTSKIKSINELLTTTLEGKYTIEIELDDKTEVIELDKFQGYSETVENFMTILASEPMKKVITHQLDKRDKERIEKWGSPASHKISIPKYNFNDLVKQYESGKDINEIVKVIDNKTSA